MFPAPAILRAATAVLAVGLLLPPLAAQEGMPPSSTLEVRQEAASMEDRIGARLDPTLEFRDERDRPYKLQQLFPGDRPVVLVPGYYGCPSMCGQVIEGMLDALNDVDLTPGQDYLIVNVSIDPRETAELAAQRKQKFLHRLHRIGGEAGWRFLTGQEPAIKALTASVGFRYFWAEHDNRFSHPPALLFVTPDGRLSRVITGTTFVPRDVRLAIVEASGGQLGTFWDEVRLNCLTWDPRTGSYALLGMTVMRIGGTITVVVLAIMLVLLVRRERRRAAAQAPAKATTQPST
jgi:protein SCO1/2